MDGLGDLFVGQTLVLDDVVQVLPPVELFTQAKKGGGEQEMNR